MNNKIKKEKEKKKKKKTLKFLYTFLLFIGSLNKILFNLYIYFFVYLKIFRHYEYINIYIYKYLGIMYKYIIYLFNIFFY